MTLIPIVPHVEAAPHAELCKRAERLADQLLRTQPRLSIDDALRPLVPERLEPAGTLHLDDLTTISLIDRFYDVSFTEDRARLRAGHGDLVASCARVEPDFEQYCRDRLALGSAKWLHPTKPRDPRGVAAACWLDPLVRDELIHAVRAGACRYLHPHMGNSAVWALAILLSRASGERLRVIAPHPRLTHAVNDKNWFAEVVTRLLGREFIPRTYRAYNFAALARVVTHLAEQPRRIVIKVPDAAGGAGNAVLDAAELRSSSLGELRKQLRELLRPFGWTTGSALLVSSWETEVLSAPSCQLWIPPEAEGAPAVEGLFEQFLEGPEGCFVGARPAALAARNARELAESAWLLGRLFQRLGYVGRCSFDAMLVGRDVERCRLKFIDCNGRWGGTSTPMTLINRLFGDWARQPFATRRCEAPNARSLSFGDLLAEFAGDLYDARTERGRLILYNPGGLRAAAGIDMVVLGRNVDEAERAALVEYPLRLKTLAEHLPAEA